MKQPLTSAVKLVVVMLVVLNLAEGGEGSGIPAQAGRTANSQSIIRWMPVGSLQNWYSSTGCEIEQGRVQVQQDGWRWPAQYSAQDMQASKALWIGTTNYKEFNTTYPQKVVHVGPRVPGYQEFMPVAMTSSSRFEIPVVRVNGDVCTNPLLAVDAVDPGLPGDHVIRNVVNTSIGLTVTRTIMQFSHPRHDNYIILEYELANTGNTDEDPDIEQPAVTLDSVYFYFLYRLAICRETRFVIGNATGWGINTMLDTRGDGLKNDADDAVAVPGYSSPHMRIQYAWHGRYPPSMYDNVGGPIWWPGWDGNPGDTVGRLGAAQFAGVLTLHADRSAADATDDPAQPSTTSWEDSDSPVAYANDQFNETKMAAEFAWMSRGHRSPRHADEVEPSGNFNMPTGDPALGTAGGFSAANGYGPYRLLPGESVKIVVAEAASGLSRERCVSVGQRYKSGTITARAKNDSVLTGRDSLFQTFRRAIANRQSGYGLGRGFPPPTSFTVTSGSSGITLAWEVPQEAGPLVRGFEIYRASGSPDGTYELLAKVDAPVRAYVDFSPVRGFQYFYYIVSLGDSASSSRHYTQTAVPSFLTSVGDDDGTGETPSTYVLEQNHPNPCNPSTEIGFRVASQGWVTLAIYDILGRQVAMLVDGVLPPGSHTAHFDAAALPTGVYLYRLTAGSFVDTKKLMVVR